MSCDPHSEGNEIEGKNMKGRYGRFYWLILVLVLFWGGPTMPGEAQGPGRVESDLQAGPLIFEQIDAHISGMSDSQIRHAYAEKLKREAAAQSASSQASSKPRARLSICPSDP